MDFSVISLIVLVVVVAIGFIKRLTLVSCPWALPSFWVPAAA